MHCRSAVVPIFVNAGAAVLPAVLGALASAAAPAVQAPRADAACRRRPLVPLAVLVLCAAIVRRDLALSERSRSSSRAHSRLRRRGTQTDWVKVAIGDDPPGRAEETMGRRSHGRAIAAPADRSTRAGFFALRVRWRHRPRHLHLLWQHDQEDAWFLSSPAVTRRAGVLRLVPVRRHRQARDGFLPRRRAAAK